MVTLTLIQGVVNTFVVFLARVVGYFVDKVLLRGEGRGLGYMATVLVCELAFGLLATIIVAWFSRQREFRADAGSAKLLGSPVPMQHALARLGGIEPGALPKSMTAAGISGHGSGFGALFSTHPPMEQRIAALSNLNLR
jgi:heat shock protein HtpX